MPNGPFPWTAPFRQIEVDVPASVTDWEIPVLGGGGDSIGAGIADTMVLMPVSGGSTINSLAANLIPDGFEVTFVNASSTDLVYFSNLGPGLSENCFALGTYQGQVVLGPWGLGPLCAVKCIRVLGQWKFVL